MEILILSNGKGEDALAVTLLKAIEEEAKEAAFQIPKVKTLPLIGEGEAYTKAGYEPLGIKYDLPSHGFTGLNPFSILKDIKAGLTKITKKQISILKRLSKDVHAIICIGDIYPVILASTFTNKPIIHLATAISVSFRKYNFFEIWLFKKRCKVVFTRDDKTANFLLSKGVNAKYLGNIMMDDPNLLAKDIDFGIGKDKKVIGLLPSSREDAYQNVIRMLKIISKMENKKNIEFILSISPNLDLGKLKRITEEISWEIKESQKPSGEIGKFYGNNGTYIRIVSGNFSDVVKRSDIIMGMTGTGNEQAVGLGTPLALIRSGTSASKERIIQYQNLLMDAVIAPSGSDKEIAKEIVDLLNDEQRLGRMSSAGKQIMGKPGAAKRIAKEMLEVLNG